MFTNYKLQITNYKLQITNYKFIKPLFFIGLFFMTILGGYSQNPSISSAKILCPLSNGQLQMKSSGVTKVKVEVKVGPFLNGNVPSNFILRPFNTKFGCTECLGGASCPGSLITSGELFIFPPQAITSTSVDPNGMVTQQFVIEMTPSSLIQGNYNGTQTQNMNLWFELYNTEETQCSVAAFTGNTNPVVNVVSGTLIGECPEQTPQVRQHANSIRTPAPNQVTKVCVTQNAKHHLDPPTGYPLEGTQKVLYCCKYLLDCKTHFTNYTLEKSNDASIYSIVDRQEDYYYLPEQTINQSLTSYRIKFSAPTGCIPGIDQHEAYYHQYTSGELRFFTSAYVYNPTIGNLANNNISVCAPASTLSITPPLMYGISNDDLIYTWTLPQGLTFTNGTRTYSAVGANSVSVLPINFGNNQAPTSEIVQLSIEWLSPCGRRDQISKSFDVNYLLNNQAPGNLRVQSITPHSGQYYDNGGVIYAGKQFCNSKPIFLESTSMSFESNNMMREWEFSDANGVIDPSLYELIATYSSLEKNLPVAQRTQTITNKRTVSFRPLDTYFTTRKVVQASINVRHRAKSACAVSPWSTSLNGVRIMQFFNDNANLPDYTVSFGSFINPTRLHQGTNITFNTNLLGKVDVAWKFYFNNRFLVPNVDYIVVSTNSNGTQTTINFNNNIFGNAPQPNAANIDISYDATFVGTCGKKTSQTKTFLLINSVTKQVSASAVNMIGKCTSFNRANSVTFTIPDDFYVATNFNLYRSNNGLRGASLNLFNMTNVLDVATNTWICTGNIDDSNASLPSFFDVEMSVLYGTKTSNRMTVNRIFTGIKNARYALPRLTADAKVFTIGQDPLAKNSHTFSVPVSNNYNRVVWTFEDVNTNVVYPSNLYTILPNDPSAASVKVEFENLTQQWLSLRAKATLIDEVDNCGNKSVTKDFTLVNFPPLEPSAPTITNPKANNQYCQSDILNLETVNNPAAIGYTWYVRGSDISFADAARIVIRGNHSTNLLNTTALRNTSTNTLTLDLKSALFNKKYLIVQLRTRYTSNITSDYGDYIEIERHATTLPPTGTITYLDPIFARGNDKLCLGNNAYFYTNVTSTDNKWIWKIDGTEVATTLEPKLKLPVTLAHDTKQVTLQVNDANGCPTAITPALTSAAMVVKNYQAPILAYYQTFVNVPVSYIRYDRPGGTLVNDWATQMSVINTNGLVNAAVDAWFWYEQNNQVSNNSTLNCQVSQSSNILAIPETPSRVNGFNKITSPANNTVKQLQPSGKYQGGAPNLPNLSCKYIVMAYKKYITPSLKECWSDPYIVMTEGRAGTGALRKEILNETPELGTELILEPVVYPNPTTGIIQIKLPTQTGTMKIYNNLGVLVFTFSLSTSDTSIDLTELTKGVYTLEIITEINTSYVKLVISE